MADAAIVAAAHDKRKRYDRQLRLWGEHGQEALENARICVLYASVAGTETAKNLVLPGVGEITIVDPYQVTKRDLGKNFFVDGDSVGKSRADTCATLLSELNDLIVVKAVQADPVELVQKKPEFFDPYTIIIVAQEFPIDLLLKLDAVCASNRKTLMVVRAYGFMGYLRISTAEHRIYESKPDNFKPDLRIMNPFPELERYALDFPITPDMDSMLYSHVPWIVFVLRDLHKWRATHDGQVPSNKVEQEAFRQMLRQNFRTQGEGNVEQAVENAHFAWAPMNIPHALKKIYEDPKTNIDASSRPFWILARAVKDFIANEGRGMPPLSGNIPDMIADTKSYVTLQTIYKEKSQRDIAAVTERVHALLRSIGRPETSISDAYIQLACKNAWFWTLIRYRFLTEEYAAPSTQSISMAVQFMQQADGGCAQLYVAMRAADRFRDKHGRMPGAQREPEKIAADAQELQVEIEKLSAELGFSGEQMEAAKHAQELARWGGAELHNIAAFMGGVAAQEVIKIATEQLVPVNNTFVYNGSASFTAVYEM